jgi:type IV secretory pathway VirB10-like protein
VDVSDEGVARRVAELTGRGTKPDSSLVAAAPPVATGLSRKILLVLGVIVGLTAFVAVWYAPSLSKARDRGADSVTVEAPRPQRPAFLDTPPKMLTGDSAQRERMRADSVRAADSIVRREEADVRIRDAERRLARARAYEPRHAVDRESSVGDIAYRKGLVARAILPAPAERRAMTEPTTEVTDSATLPAHWPIYSPPPSLLQPRSATTYASDGDRSRRKAFLVHAGESDQDTLAPIGDTGWMLAAGTAISAELLVNVNSDLPGDLTAQVTRDVYDSRTERLLLIPKGSRLVGRYDDRIVVGQHRLLVAWTRLMFANGRSAALPGLQATDQQGASGIVGAVVQHIGQQFGDALLLSLLGAGVELSQPREGVYGTPSVGGVAGAALGQQLSEVALELVRQHADVPPTISVPLGTRFNVYVNRDLVFRRSE